MQQTLDPVTLDEFRRLLERKRSELIQKWLHPDEYAAERFADALDGLVSQAARQVVAEQMNRYSITLADIDGAIGRIADGSYGVCTECGAPILAKRLSALPWTTHCLFCQQIHDRSLAS